MTGTASTKRWARAACHLTYGGENTRLDMKVAIKELFRQGHSACDDALLEALVRISEAEGYEIWAIPENGNLVLSLGLEPNDLPAGAFRRLRRRQNIRLFNLLYGGLLNETQLSSAAGCTAADAGIGLRRIV